MSQRPQDVRPGRSRPAVLLAVFLALFSLAALLEAAPESPQAMQATRVAVGDEAIDFELQSLAGDTYVLSALEGERPAVLIFFRGAW